MDRRHLRQRDYRRDRGQREERRRDDGRRRRHRSVSRENWNREVGIYHNVERIPLYEYERIQRTAPKPKGKRCPNDAREIARKAGAAHLAAKIEQNRQERPRNSIRLPDRVRSVDIASPRETSRSRSGSESRPNGENNNKLPQQVGIPDNVGNGDAVPEPDNPNEEANANMRLKREDSVTSTNSSVDHTLHIVTDDEEDDNKVKVEFDPTDGTGKVVDKNIKVENAGEENNRVLNQSSVNVKEEVPDAQIDKQILERPESTDDGIESVKSVNLGVDTNLDSEGLLSPSRESNTGTHGKVSDEADSGRDTDADTERSNSAPNAFNPDAIEQDESSPPPPPPDNIKIDKNDSVNSKKCPKPEGISTPINITKGLITDARYVSDKGILNENANQSSVSNQQQADTPISKQNSERTLDHAVQHRGYMSPPELEIGITTLIGKRVTKFPPLVKLASDSSQYSWPHNSSPIKLHTSHDVIRAEEMHKTTAQPVHHSNDQSVKAAPGVYKMNYSLLGDDCDGLGLATGPIPTHRIVTDNKPSGFIPPQSLFGEIETKKPKFN